MWSEFDFLHSSSARLVRVYRIVPPVIVWPHLPSASLRLSPGPPTTTMRLVLLPLVCMAILSTPTLATSGEFHLHRVDAVYDKCFEASSRSKFANQHVVDTGKCPPSYNKTVDELVAVLQCPDGVTSIRDCSPINVTIATKARTHQFQSMVADDLADDR